MLIKLTGTASSAKPRLFHYQKTILSYCRRQHFCIDYTLTLRGYIVFRMSTAAGDRGFYVHLVSNVSGETFPNNTPSEFSTILAEDIDLQEGNWEVAVKNILYPSHIATATEKENIEILTYADRYREILPVPGRYTREIAKNYVNLTFDLATTRTKPDAKELSSTAIAEHMNKVIQKSNLKRVLIFRTNNDNSKFILDIFKADMPVLLHPELRKYLGFENDEPLQKGSHWAWSKFDGKRELPNKESQVTIVCDLLNQIKEVYTLQRSYQFATGSTTPKEPLKPLYTVEVPLKFKDNKDDDLLWEPSTLLTVNPLEGKITLNQTKTIPAYISQYERRITFLRFDAPTRQALKLKDLYLFKKLSPATFTIDIPPVKDAKSLAKITSFKVEIYFEGVRELSRELIKEPLDVIRIPSDKPFKKPLDLLDSLNTWSYQRNYTFKYSSERQRFAVRTGRNIFLKFNPTIASILGFTNLPPDNIIADASFTMANDFPLLDRAITTLYVYSNIVETVYIGDVKAPILLTCPFRNDPNSNVVQIEFLNPTYCKLNRSTIHQLDVAIYDDAGVIVPFLYGKTNLTLHFRRTY